MFYSSPDADELYYLRISELIRDALTVNGRLLSANSGRWQVASALVELILSAAMVYCDAALNRSGMAANRQCRC
jgi:hypothetical protein